MLELPSRGGLATLADAVSSIGKVPAFGLIRQTDDGRTSFLCCARNAVAEYRLAANQSSELLFRTLLIRSIFASRHSRQARLAMSDSAFARPASASCSRSGGLSRDARQMLIAYHWPGNVRELRNILERAAILCDGGLIVAEHLALTVSPTAIPAPAPAVRPAIAADAPEKPIAAPASTVPASPTGDLHSMERTMIEQALHNARFNKSKAAKALGLTRRQLYIRMKRHGFD